MQKRMDLTLKMQKAGLCSPEKKYWQQKYSTTPLLIPLLSFCSLLLHLSLPSFIHFGCKGAWSVISYYNGSVAKALLDLFPNIGLDKFWGT
jgi:hypothetical protein